MLHSRWKALCVVSLVLAGCDELTELEPGACGNHVVDGDRYTGEDCDGFAADGFAADGCGKPTDGARACRHVCDAATPCKANWACGEDGICREPSGAFEPAARSISARMNWMDVADFDGDGQVDLLGGDPNHIDVHYLGLDLGSQKTVPVPVGRSLPRIGHLTDDTRPDIVTTAREGEGPGGIVVLRAQADRTLSHTAYSSLDIPDSDGIGIRIFGADVDPLLQGDEAVAFAEYPIDPTESTSVIFLPFFAGDQRLHVVEFPANELAGDIVVGDLDEDPLIRCDELVYARLNAETVNVLHTCRTYTDAMTMEDVVEINHQFSGMGAFVPPTSVSLPAGAKDIQRATLFDMNGDDYLDIVLDAKLDAPQDRRRAFVAYGVGDGTFHSSDILPPSGTPGDGVASLYLGFPYFPLAIGHLDADGIPDFVTQCFICSTASIYFIGADCPLPVEGDAVPCTESEQPPSPGVPGTYPYREAFIGDMNDNGFADVTVSFAGRPGIRFYSGAGNAAYNLFEIPTDAKVAHLTPGDFDGDLLPDLALAQLDEDKSHSLAILFGRRDVDPTPPIVIGRIGEILQLAPASLPGGEFGYDAITDLGALSLYSSEGEQRVSVALLLGRTDRQIHAPHALSYLPRGSGAEDDDFLTDAALVPAIGELTGDGHPDVAAVGSGIESFDGEDDDPPGGYRIWVVPATGDAELDRVTQVPTTIAEGFNPVDSMVATKDLDGDGIDELVLLQDTLVGGGRILVAKIDGGAWGVIASEDVAPQFSSVIHLDDGFEISTDPLGEFDVYNRIALLDVDGDATNGARDIDVAALAQWDGVIRLVVFPNADGVLAFDAPVALELPEGLLIGYTFIQAEEDAAQEIAVIMSSGVWLGHVGADFVVDWYLLPRDRESNDARLPRAIAAADMNGDGMQDLLLSHGEEGEIEIHLGQERKQ